MQILDGKIASAAIREELTGKITSLKASGKRAPHLAAILIGHNPASETYVASKVRNCQEIGITSTLLRFEETLSEAILLSEIEKLSNDPLVDGILVQLPLPSHINESKVIDAIPPHKDVDGFHPINVGKMVLGLPSFLSATPYGILLLLQHYHIHTEGKHVVVLGRSNIVGTPISILLSRNSPTGNATVTLCHSKTRNLKETCREADILIAAIGRPCFVTPDMVADQAVVIDVGMNRVVDSSKKSGFALKGDVDFEKVAPKCSYITPVPGGVGLMTIAALLMNTYQAFTQKNTWK